MYSSPTPCMIVTAGQKCIIQDKAGTILLQAPKYHGLYRVDNQPAEFTTCICLDSFEMHKWLGHISQKSMKVLFDQGLVLGLELKTLKDKIVCDACIKSKITCKPLPKESRERTKELGEHVYTDVWGPAHHVTINNKYYYISFTDDYLRESVIYLMKHKSEAFEKYKIYEAMIKTQRNVKIKSLVSDRGGEYTSCEFKQHLDKQGTAQKLTVHDTPESNGIAERLN